MRKDGPESRLPTALSSFSQSHVLLTHPPLTVHMFCVQWVQLILLSFNITQQVVGRHITPLCFLIICPAGKGGHSGEWLPSPLPISTPAYPHW